jgi:hypothetical protein
MQERLKLNLSDTHISWKGYLIGSLTPKINIHLMAYKKKTDSLKMSTVKNPTLSGNYGLNDCYHPSNELWWKSGII